MNEEYKEYQVRVFPNGDIHWYMGPDRHREGGPAIECANGDKIYYQYNLLHREEGPAIIYALGRKCWYIRGKHLTEEEFNSRNQNCDGKVVEIDGKKYKLTFMGDGK